MRFVLYVGLAALVVSGCSREDAAKSSAYGTAREPRRPDAPRPTPVPIETARTGEIPEAFHGVWDYVKGSCDPASDLRMDIGARAIEFYESHGTVTAVEDATADAVTVTLAMEGEGETWETKERFTLSDGGKTLTPRMVADQAGAPMPLKRCPADAAQ